MKKLLLLIPIIYLFILLIQVEKAFTQDLGRHLLLGKLILDCLCVPKTNLFSYTAPSFLFINHHWVPEVLFYVITQFLNLTALLWVKIGIIVASFVPILVLAKRKSSSVIAGMFAIPFIFVFSERFDARPEIFSFLFIAITVYLLSRYRDTANIFLLFPIPFIQLVWVNSHIYFFVGLALLFFLLLDLIVRKKNIRGVLVVFVIACIATSINPHGLTGALYPFQVFDNYGYSIVENQNIFFLNSFFFNPRILVFELLALLAIVSILIQFKARNYFFALSICFAVFSGFFMIRNFPLFVLIAFPGVAHSVFVLQQKLSPKMHKQVTICLVSAVMLFTGIHIVQFVQSPYFGLRYIYGAEKAVDFFEEEKISGPLFNNFDIGSYLIYRLYPEERVFVDGRPEAYPATFFDEYKNMQTDSDFFKQQVIRYNIRTIFFAHTDITPWAQNFLQTIIEDPEWVTVYVDEMIIILLRDIPENQEIISKNRIIQ